MIYNWKDYIRKDKELEASSRGQEGREKVGRNSYLS